MKRLAFWCAVFLLCAAITHLGYVLYAPRRQMAAIMAEAIAITPANSLALLDREQQARLFPEDTALELRALCPFDLAAGNVLLSGSMPPSPWAIAVYAPRGELVYSLAREQAGVDAVSITIKQAKSLAETISPRETGAILNDGWTLEFPGEAGLAVIWAAMGSRLERGRQEAHFKLSSCGAKQAP